MGGKTTIEWTDKTWNPVTGCTKVSRGCKNCYAERLFPRVYSKDVVAIRPLDGGGENGGERPRQFTDIRLHEDRLKQPMKWREPSRIFVNSMSDLFHEGVPNEFVDQVFAIMALCPLHTFQVLTKRPERMRDYMARLVDGGRRLGSALAALGIDGVVNRIMLASAFGVPSISRRGEPPYSPSPNVWLGVSCEDQETADERIPLLLQTPAAVRFISAEPLLGAIDLREHLWTTTGDFRTHHGKRQIKLVKRDVTLDWVIAGGESGPNARPMHPSWARTLRDQCRDAGVAYFFKQWGAWEIASTENGHHWSVMPDTDIRATWVGVNGKTYNPSAPDGLDCYAMARVVKKKSGHALDGEVIQEYPR